MSKKYHVVMVLPYIPPADSYTFRRRNESMPMVQRWPRAEVKTIHEKFDTIADVKNFIIQKFKDEYELVAVIKGKTVRLVLF